MWRRFAIIFLLLTLPGATFAHHSNAEYDRDHRNNLKGTVLQIKWANPHVQIVFQVKARGGATQTWIGEGPPPSQMIENGCGEIPHGTSFLEEVQGLTEGRSVRV